MRRDPLGPGQLGRGFLVQNGRAVVYDLQARRILMDRCLVEPLNYPTTKVARDLSFREHSLTLIFRECHRWSSECTDWITVEIANGS